MEPENLKLKFAELIASPSLNSHTPMGAFWVASWREYVRGKYTFISFALVATRGGARLWDDSLKLSFEISSSNITASLSFHSFPLTYFGTDPAQTWVPVMCSYVHVGPFVLIIYLIVATYTRPVVSIQPTHAHARIRRRRNFRLR